MCTHMHACVCASLPSAAPGRTPCTVQAHRVKANGLGLVAFALFLSGLHFSFSFALVCRTTSSFKREHIPHKIEIQVPKEGDRKTVCVCDIGRMSNNNNNKKKLTKVLRQAVLTPKLWKSFYFLFSCQYITLCVCA